MRPADRPRRNFVLPLLVFLVLAVAIGGAGYEHLLRARETFRAEAWNQLSAIADIRVNQVTSWRNERLADARMLSSAAALPAMRQVLAGTATPASISEIRQFLEGCRNGGYENAILIDREGRVRLAAGSTGSAEHYTALLKQVVDAGGVVLTDFHLDSGIGGIHLGLLVPLRAEGGAMIGILALGIDPGTSLYPLIQSWPTASRSGEIVLARREGDEVLFLNDLRYRKSAALKLRLPVNGRRAPVAGRAVLGREGTFEGLDYRGVPVLAASLKVPGTSWFLVAKVDRQEAETPLRRQATSLAIVLIFLIGATGTGLGLLWSHQRSRFHRQEYEAQAERRALVGHFDYLSHYANDIILLMEADGRIIEANERACGAYGYNREELLTKRFSDLCHPRPEAGLEAGWDAEHGSAGQVFEAFHRRHDGTSFPVEVSMRTIDVDGIEYRQTIVRDITERRAMEEELRQAKQKLEAVIDAAPAGIVGLDTQGRIQLWNRAAERIHGWKAEEVLGRSFPDAVYPGEEQDGGGQVWRDMAAGKIVSRFEVARRRKDGSTVEISVSSAPLFDADGATIGAMAIVSDVTDRKRAERSLIESEDRFRQVVANAPDGVFIQTRGRLRYVNPAAISIFGAESEDRLLDQEVLDRVHPDYRELVRERIRRVLDDRRAVPPLQQKYLRLDGSAIDVETSGVPFRYLNEDGGLVFFRDITGRKRAEEALRESERRMQLAVQVSRTGLWDYDLRTANVYYSPEWKAQLGYGSDEVGCSLNELESRLHPEDRERAVAAIKSLDPSSPDFELEFRLRHKDGSYRWILCRGALLFNAQGQPRRVIGSHMDFTERKKMEEELDASRRLVHRILNATPDLLYIYDLAEGRNTFANRQLTEFLGYSSERAQALGGNLMGQILHPDDAAAVAEHYRRCYSAADGETLDIEYRMRHAGGHWCWVHCRDMVFARINGVPSRILGVAQDITERKHAEDALRRSEARLERAQRIAELGNWEATTHSLEEEAAEEPYHWSDELYRIWGVSRETFAPTLNNFMATIHPEDREAVRSTMLASLSSGKPFRVDHRIVRPDGTQRWVREHAELEADDSGRSRMIGTAQDVTEYKRLQDQFLQAQRLESIGRLAGGVAHDFNNLLTVIICCSELVLDELPADGFLSSSVGEIRKAAQRAAALTEQLLAFGRRQVVQPRILNPNLVIQDVEKMMGRLIGEDIELITHLDTTGYVVADPNQVNQILMNLAVNARDAMPHGGRLVIETRDLAMDESRRERHPELGPGPYVELTVSDTGSGMDEYTRSHLFEPFFTTKEKAKGTGLGLSTVYGIVKQAGGHIWVYSRTGEGTTFHVCLPRVEGETAATEVSRPPLAELRGTETLLVVEDQAEVRHLAMEVLESYGYKVLGAASGPDALQLCEIYTGPIQLMVTDVVMPGMTGRELASRLTQLRPSMRVLFMSGYTDNAMTGQGGLSQELAYLQKPFSPLSLASKVRETLACPLKPDLA
jgi:two-component system cell cycle sensor histidine kinase/response regulator CckA